MNALCCADSCLAGVGLRVLGESGNNGHNTHLSDLPTPTRGSAGRIAFVSNRDGNPEIYVMNADGSGVTRLTNNPAEEWMPAWSPDGTRIAFVSGRDGNYEIYLTIADGRGQINLTNNPADDGTPAWSPR
jgi:dipeptidyl aminopeptidase/acylaminoacyl peptidase